VVRFEAVHKRYRRGPEVLAGVDLLVRPGEPLLVVGANGSGKSTLLRLAAGCATPNRGRVRDRPAIVGDLPDRFPASPRLPIHAYLRHLAAVHGVAPGPALDRAAHLLAELGFPGDPDAPVSRLSKGGAQKVGLAQALCCGARLLVLDEPFSGLDAVAAAALVARLDAEVAGGAALLLADHTGWAADLAGARAVRLDGGRAVPDVVARRPQPGAGEQVVVELRCPGDPAGVLADLPPVAAARIGPAGDGLLTVRLPAVRGDGLLAAALARGCSVLAVRRAAPGGGGR
jgi:ABC-2 type transport system ATP-binding protein